MLGWIYFRAPDMATANAMIFSAFDVRKLSTMSMRENDYLITFLYMTSFLLAAGLVVLNTKKLIPAWLRFAGLLIAQAVMFTLVFLLLRQAKSFIYFNF
jgi:hypothetical protein